MIISKKKFNHSVDKSIHEKNEAVDLNILEDTKILCLHCKRTNTNQIRCQGMCVQDNEY